MWSNVDNELSRHPGTRKPYGKAVDNDCGQMCSIFFRRRGRADFAARAERRFAARFPLDFDAFFSAPESPGSNHRRARSRVDYLSTTESFPHHDVEALLIALQMQPDAHARTRGSRSTRVVDLMERLHESLEPESDEGLTTADRIIGGISPRCSMWCSLVRSSIDPWSSRVHPVQFADYAVIDLVPDPRAPVFRVVTSDGARMLAGRLATRLATRLAARAPRTDTVGTRV